MQKLHSFHIAKYFLALIGGRSKRRKVEKKSSSAFDKLRELKSGKKNKWDSLNDQDDKLYDEVDEEEYGKIVSARASDWIVDDGGIFNLYEI